MKIPVGDQEIFCVAAARDDGTLSLCILPTERKKTLQSAAENTVVLILSLPPPFL